MDINDPDSRLSRISTLWSLVRQAHEGPAEDAARHALFERYEGAVRRYLRRLLRDADAAEEVFQEFALELVRGGLGGADPRRGRFRNFVKGALFHLVAKYRKQQKRWPAPLPDGGVPDMAEPAFEESWCDELLARAWAALGDIDAGTPYYAVLRLRSERPELSSSQLAAELTQRLGKTITAVGCRQLLHRAREKFAELLLTEVAAAMDNPTRQQLEAEVIELGLLDYCKAALDKSGQACGARR